MWLLIIYVVIDHTRTAALDTESVYQGELLPSQVSPGGESDTLVTIEPYPIPVSDLETIVLASTSIPAFRECYREILFPLSDPEAPKQSCERGAAVRAFEPEHPAAGTGSWGPAT
jgi:hypothetical protein